MITREELRESIEEWRPIDDWPEYEVSNLGRVRNARTRLVRKLHRHKFGYVMVSLQRDGKKVAPKRVHRLVAFAFLAPAEGQESKTEVNHIDHDPTNNVAWNLEWVTPRDNIRHSMYSNGKSEAIEKGRRSDGRFGPVGPDDDRVRDHVHQADREDPALGEVPF